MIRVVAALLERDGRVLVAQRPAGKARALRWELPGGKVEAGEGDAEALARECLEELAVEVTVAEPVGSVTHSYDDLTIQLVLYRAQLADRAQPREDDAHALAWVAIESLAELDLCDADRKLLPAITSGRSRTA
jgi:8-oxo-dGTP diphosphatase